MDIPGLTRANPAWATKAVMDVLAERERQRSKGYDAKHDDGHTVNQLARAGAVYALLPWRLSLPAGIHRALWPFQRLPGVLYVREMLVRGAAMLLAAIERYDRALGLQQPVVTVKIRACKFSTHNDSPCVKCGHYRAGLQCEDIDGAMVE